MTSPHREHPAPVPASSSSARVLERRLGPVDAAAIVIANVIGVGIFITPGIIATAVPHPVWILGVWIAGGLLAFAGAAAYAELATLRPRSGGEYVYLREGFGSLAAFLTGWTSFVAGFAGAMAAAALNVGKYLGAFFPAAADPTPLVSLPLGPLSFVVSRQSLVALTAVGGLAFVHIRGLGPGRLVQNTLAGLKVAALTIFVAAGLSLGDGTLAHVTSAAGLDRHRVERDRAGDAPRDVHLQRLECGLVRRRRNPRSRPQRAHCAGRRNRRRRAGLSRLEPAVHLRAARAGHRAPWPRRPTDRQSPMRRPSTCSVPTAARMLGALAVVILLSSLSAMTVAGPRVYYAMARDGVFFRSAATIHPRFHTPWIAIIAQAVWCGLLVLTNTSDQLATYTGFAVLLFSGFAVSAVFVLRRRHPNEPRPFRAWGYPVAPAIFTFASLAITVFAIVGRQRESLWGLLIMLAGIPIYLFMRWRDRAAATPPKRPMHRACAGVDAQERVTASLEFSQPESESEFWVLSSEF